MQERIEKHFERLGRLPLSVQASMTTRITISKAFENAIRRIVYGNHAFIIGNGGSASIASHMAEDYTKNGGIRMSAFNDAALLTCFANDYGYERMFEMAVEHYMDKSDLLIAISSSGKSPNILNGVKAAKVKGCHVMTFSGFAPDNPLRQLGDLNFYVPDDSYGNVEITHLSLLHTILDFICEDKK